MNSTASYISLLDDNPINTHNPYYRSVYQINNIDRYLENNTTMLLTILRGEYLRQTQIMVLIQYILNILLFLMATIMYGNLYFASVTLLQVILFIYFYRFNRTIVKYVIYIECFLYFILFVTIMYMIISTGDVLTYTISILIILCYANIIYYHIFLCYIIPHNKSDLIDVIGEVIC